MDKQFWHERWEANQIGFHQQEINSDLQQFWHNLVPADGSTVFVPLCGKSRDMLWLREQGFRVLGVELSPIATADFFTENRLTPHVTPQGAFTRWEFDHLSILCGDLFDLQTSDINECRSIYDRASLIALPKSLRSAYVEKMHQLFPTPKPTLLITLDYPQQEMAGPPFAVDRSEVLSLYQDCYEVNRCHTREVLSENPQFRKRGVSHMVEEVYQLIPRN